VFYIGTDGRVLYWYRRTCFILGQTGVFYIGTDGHVLYWDRRKCFILGQTDVFCIGTDGRVFDPGLGAHNVSLIYPVCNIASLDSAACTAMG
jgi:PAS domain-containing protein